jgi:hypothetical protein
MKTPFNIMLLLGLVFLGASANGEEQSIALIEFKHKISRSAGNISFKAKADPEKRCMLLLSLSFASDLDPGKKFVLSVSRPGQNGWTEFIFADGEKPEAFGLLCSFGQISELKQVMADEAVISDTPKSN